MLTPRNTEFHKPRRVFLLHLNKTNNSNISLNRNGFRNYRYNKNWNICNFFLQLIGKYQEIAYYALDRTATKLLGLGY